MLFYAALPKCPEYPCYVNMLPECCERLEQGMRTHCMDSDLDERIEEVVAGARLLMAPDFDLVAATRTYETLAHQKGIKIDRLYYSLLMDLKYDREGDRGAGDAYL